MTNLVIHANQQPVTPDYAGRRLRGSERLSWLIKGEIRQRPARPAAAFEPRAPRCRPTGSLPDSAAPGAGGPPHCIKGLINLARLAGTAPPGALFTAAPARPSILSSQRRPYGISKNRS